MKQPVLLGVLPILHQGKVRDTYVIPGHSDLRLIHVTDRVSTHNVSHLSLIPEKGEILLAITLFWEQMLRIEKGTFTHTVAFGQGIYDYLPKNKDYPDDFHRQAMVVRQVQMFPYEFIYRGRLAGSLEVLYRQGLPNPYGLTLTPGLRLMDEFPQPIFTPTEKSATDDPVAGNALIGVTRTDIRVFGGIYAFMRKFALSRGIDIIDTKIEGGLFEGRRTLADEWGTPDSSRFVDASSIQIGEEPRWLDKEFLRNEAMEVWRQTNTLKEKPPITFSAHAIGETRKRYHEIVERLTGKSLADLQQDLGIT